MKISALLLVCALTLSGIAAYYSIVGLAAIFASAFWPVVFMAGTLEVSKLVLASWLYQKWNSIPVLIKTYLTAAVVILMMITSLGIFGFLSKAHVDQNLGNTDVTLKIEQIDTQITQIKDKITRYQSALQQLDRTINIQLDNQRVQQALAARRQQEKERDQIRQQLDQEQNQLQQLNQQRTILKAQFSILESKVGPIRYVAEFFYDGKNVDLDSAVRYMIVILVLVFDPLAVLMLIAANMTYVKETTKANNEHIEQKAVQTASIGQVIYSDIANEILWFDGNNWKKVKNDKESIELDKPAMPVSNQENFNTEKIHQIVKDAMDEWLTNFPSGEQNNAKESNLELAESARNKTTKDTVQENSSLVSPVDADTVIGRILQHHEQIDKDNPSNKKPLWPSS